MFGVFAIDEILRYRWTRFVGSRTLCHPVVAYDLAVTLETVQLSPPEKRFPLLFFFYKDIHSSVSMATSTVGKAEAKVEKAEDTEEGRVTRVADTGLLISSSNITLYTQYILLRSKHWATPHQRVLWINPVANISFPLITPEIAGFEFRSHYPLYSIYVHCRKGRKYCYGDSEGEYCHCDYCKCKHGYGLKVALFYFWLVYSTSWT